MTNRPVSEAIYRLHDAIIEAGLDPSSLMSIEVNPNLYKVLLEENAKFVIYNPKKPLKLLDSLYGIKIKRRIPK